MSIVSKDGIMDQMTPQQIIEMIDVLLKVAGAGTYFVSNETITAADNKIRELIELIK